MEPWFIYSLISILFTWLFSFSSKISVEKNHNPTLVTLYSYMVATFFWLSYFIFSWMNTVDYKLEILFWTVNWVLYFITSITRINSLKYIDTWVYFPIYKSLWPIILLVTTFLFFSESFSNKEMIWIFLWILVPLFLVWQGRKSKNLMKWFIYLIIWLLSALLAWLSGKLATMYHLNMLSYAVFSLFIWAISSYFLYKFNEKKHKSIFSISKIKRIWAITWLLNFVAFYTFMKAVEARDNIWIVYVFQSLYIVVPIILSIIIYKEHFDFKKFIAIILTVTSVFFMK